MTITLPDETQRQIEQRAAAEGFPSAEEYVEELIEDDVEDAITEEDFRRGDADIAAGRGRPMEQVIRDLAE